jgi:small-conductance mechanosensitive channel
MSRRGWIAAVGIAAALHASGLVAQESAAPPPDAAIETAPVEIDGRTLFAVRGTSSYPAAQRAADIRERLVRLARDPALAPESLEMVEVPLGTQIQAGTARVMIVTDADAELEGISRAQLAATIGLRMRESLRVQRAERSRESLLEAGRRTAIAFALFLVGFLALRWTGRRLSTAIESQFHKRVRSLAIGSFEFVRVERLRGYLSGLLRAFRALAAVLVTFVFLDYSLRQFPWTRSVGERLGDWVVGPLEVLGGGLIALIPDLIFLVVLWFVTKWLLRLVRLFFEGVGRGEVELSGFDRDWAEPTYKILRVAMIVFALVVAYPYIPGSESEAFKGLSLFVGLVFSLGSSSVISNIIAGYTMTYRRLFRAGDRVRIGNVSGAVTEVRLQVTHLRTPKNEEVVVPNSSILNSEVTNYTTLAKSDGLILHTTVGIGYETPWRQVEAMLLLAAERTPGLAAGRQPFVLQKGLGDFAVNYELNVYTDDPARMPFLYAELHRQILDVFNEYGIQIMTPAYEGDPEVPKVVPREQWFTAPAKPVSGASHDRPAERS